MQEIIFWKNHPAIHDDRFYQAMARYYRVLLVCDTRTPQSRINSSGWSAGSGVDTVYLSDFPSSKTFVHDFIKKKQDAIHVLCGLRGCVSVRLAFPRLIRLKNPHLLLSFESPTKTSGLKKIAQTLIYRHLLRQCRGKVAALFAMGNMGCTVYKRLGFPANKIYPTMYSYPGKYPDLAGPRLSSEPLRIVFVGDAVPAKGVQLLIKAVKLFPAERLQLTFVGNDPLKIAAKAAAAPDGKEKIRLLGVVPNTRILEILASHDLLILPSFNDGWGMVVTEALIAGIGAIVTNACGAQDIPLNYDTGLVIPAESQTALNKALEKAVSEPETILRWKINARRYRDQTRPEQTADTMYQIINQLFGNENLPQ